jgi:hypothetical protein
MLRYFLALGIVVGVAAPALAAEYYVVRGADKKCKVVETRPVDKTVVVVATKSTSRAKRPRRR